MKISKQPVNVSLCLFNLVFFSAIACAPQGELTKTLHPPHKKYLDRLAPTTAASVNIAIHEEAQQLTKGLPDSCKIDKASELKLHCQSESWIVVRSYDFKGPLDPNVDCQYNNEIIKCLTKNPPFAIYLDWHSSHEKFLRENFLVWKESVHQIWDDKLSDEDRRESESILASLDWLTSKLSSTAVMEANDGDLWVKSLGLDASQGKKGQEFLNAVQSTRLSGKINLRLVLDKVDAFYDQTHGPSTLWEELRTMSLEGLED